MDTGFFDFAKMNKVKIKQIAHFRIFLQSFNVGQYNCNKITKRSCENLFKIL